MPRSTIYFALAATAALMPMTAGACSPAEVASVPLGSSSWDVRIQGDYAFIANNENGLRVIDISAPTMPVTETAVSLAGDFFQNMTISGNTAYLCNISFGPSFVACDITDPANASFLAFRILQGAPGGHVQDLSADGNLIACTETTFGVLHLYDITTPSNPFEAGQFPTSPGNAAVALIGTTAFVGNPATQELLALDVSSPATPTVLDSVSISTSDTYAIALAGDHAYVATGAALVTVDISDPMAMAVTDTLPAPAGASFQEIGLSGERMVLGGPATSAFSLELTDPAAPAMQGSIDFVTHLARGVATNGRYLFVASDTSGLKVVDLISCPIGADLDGSGGVGGADLAILLAAWGPCPMTGPCPADLNNDGVVDAADLAILLAGWG